MKVNLIFLSIILVIFAGILIFTACSSNLQTAEFVEVEAYLGDWYQIASIPTWFQDKCLGCDMANYQLAPQDADYDIQVTNTCKLKPKNQDEDPVAKAKAWVDDKETNSKLKVQFPGMPFFVKADYWITMLGEKNEEGKYSYAVVATPNKKYLWILNRDKEMEESTYQKIITELKEKGFDTDSIVKTDQSVCEE
jgi:apolipoprotein D and lipocalin family protein